MTRSAAIYAIDQLTLTTPAPQRTAIGSAPTVVKPMSGGHMTTDRASRMHTDTEGANTLHGLWCALGGRYGLCAFLHR